MLESSVEKYLVEQIRLHGGLCWKWVCPGHAGVPDRIVLLPGGRIIFVETKAPGKKERPLQEYIHGRLRKLGFSVYGSVDTKERVREVVNEICTA